RHEPERREDDHDRDHPDQWRSMAKFRKCLSRRPGQPACGSRQATPRPRQPTGEIRSHDGRGGVFQPRPDILDAGTLVRTARLHYGRTVRGYSMKYLGMLWLLVTILMPAELGGASRSPALVRIADIPLPGKPSRFDYQSFD